jgi:peptide/nickel transport system substrate-binding protein
MNPGEVVPNERLRRARSLKGWSQAQLAEQVGTSFEMVSRWERGITVPSSYYRERLCAVLGQSAEDLWLVRGRLDAFTPPSTPLVLLASSHEDAEKALVSHLKSALQERGYTLWSSRQLSKQGNGTAQPTLREIVRTAQVILVIISPEARTSRHVREALETASRYQRPVCSVWIEGEHWQECLPKDSGELAALIDARGRDDAALLEEIATALERAGLASRENGMSAPAGPEAQGAASEPRAPSQGFQAVMPAPDRALEPTAVATQLSADVPLLPKTALPVHRRRVSRTTAALLIGLVVVVIAGGVLGSVSLFVHFGVLGGRSSATNVSPIRGGIWTDDFSQAPNSFIPNHGLSGASWLAFQALYLPLFYSDAQGAIHAGAASEIPTVQNGGISADAKTWTFHLRSHLVWSDGQPYNARDVDFSWRLWVNPKFGAFNPLDPTLISGADVSADDLSITFHLTRAFAPFLSLWIDGLLAPLPAHRFSRVAPDQIYKSPDNLNPQVVSGPFMMGESVPGDHYTLVRNPNYYRASEGLPYLDKVIFRIVTQDDVLKDLQAGAIDSSAYLFGQKFDQYQRLRNYSFITSPTTASFEALWFNFHNQVLASHLEVRQAMAMAIDHQALIAAAPAGLDTPLCTDHPSAMHPGYDPSAYCPVFDPATANKLLEDNGWVKGPDGVRSKGQQHLEFEYSTAVTYPAPGRLNGEMIVQRNLQAIGIKLDIQNYDNITFFAHLLPDGKASPPTGAVAGRYDIAEFALGWGYDPDDSSIGACDNIPPKGLGTNLDFYCNHALDALYTQEQKSVDPGVRQQIFFQIHQIYLTDFPFIVLYGALFGGYGLARKGTHNYQPSPFIGETSNIWQWWCDNGKC